MSEMVVAQLHRALVDAIRRTRPVSADSSVTVSEIYQELVPYHVARTDLGFEMNGDYEHALLRLLAGEGDLARIEPREVRDKIRLELESPNPDVGLYRDYAACDVWVNIGDDNATDVVDLLAENAAGWEDDFVGPSLSEAEQGYDVQHVAPIETGQETNIEPPTPVEEPEADAPPPAFQMASEPRHASQPLKRVEHDTDSCVVCGGELPPGRLVNFCPFCGSDQSQRPCPTCGEMLEPLWRFCVACGTRVRSAGDDVN